MGFFRTNQKYVIAFCHYRWVLRNTFWKFWIKTKGTQKATMHWTETKLNQTRFHWAHQAMQQITSIDIYQNNLRWEMKTHMRENSNHRLFRDHQRVFHIKESEHVCQISDTVVRPSLIEIVFLGRRRSWDPKLCPDFLFFFSFESAFGHSNGTLTILQFGSREVVCASADECGRFK